MNLYLNFSCLEHAAVRGVSLWSPYGNHRATFGPFSKRSSSSNQVRIVGIWPWFKRGLQHPRTLPNIYPYMSYYVSKSWIRIDLQNSHSCKIDDDTDVNTLLYDGTESRRNVLIYKSIMPLILPYHSRLAYYSSQIFLAYLHHICTLIANPAN